MHSEPSVRRPGRHAQRRCAALPSATQTGLLSLTALSRQVDRPWSRGRRAQCKLGLEHVAVGGETAATPRPVSARLSALAHVRVAHVRNSSTRFQAPMSTFTRSPT